MVVRAASHITAGDEVSISYLGRPQLMPVELRIETLREDYGFTCECERCTAELVHMDKVSIYAVFLLTPVPIFLPRS